jgi:DNA-binding transcriptional ArsR family regulator
MVNALLAWYNPISGMAAPVADLLRALANERRLRILQWLKDPRRHFPPQVDGDLVEDGVCSLFIARKLKITPPSASEHLNMLAAAGLIRGRKIKQWTFYKRDERALRRVKGLLRDM